MTRILRIFRRNGEKRNHLAFRYNNMVYLLVGMEVKMKKLKIAFDDEGDLL